MNIEDIIKRLFVFNSWRTGEDERTMEEAGIIPSQVTQDIKYICEYCQKLEADLRRNNIYMDIDFKEIQYLKHQLKQKDDQLKKFSNPS